MVLETAYFERHIARLLVVLYHCGRPVNSLLDGETRQVDSIWQLQRFDFWVREPGHLALALLAQKPLVHSLQQAHIERMMADGQVDIHRVGLPGVPSTYLEDFDANLSFLTSRALVSDRPSFVKSHSYAHQIVLESHGIALVRQILAECPSFDWYRIQCKLIADNFPVLDAIDLSTMTYLEPDVTPAQAALAPLLPIIQARYAALFGEASHVDV